MISSDEKVNNYENSSISKEEADATESKSEVDCSEVSFGYETLTFED